MNRPILGLIVLLSLASASRPARAQTVQGDILRGQGRYLEGAGWYNFNTARAGRINVETWKSYNREVQRLYRDYMADRSKHMQAGLAKTNAVQAEIQRKFEENERRWRTNPTAADIASGDALNALAIDLADESISPSAWGSAEVALPPNLTLTALAFKIADPKKARIQQSTVAIDRMLVKDDWPLPFRYPEIQKECAAYKKAVEVVVEKCRKGTPIQGTDYDKLRNSVETLNTKVFTAVPTRDNLRIQAREYVKKLDETSKLFAEQEYAEQLVRDVMEHKDEARSVAGLLAFMRDYRLLFADAGQSPEVASLYEDLYGLLRRQKDALGGGGGARAGRGGGGGGEGRGAPGAPSDAFAAGTVWVNVDADRPMRLRVLERDGGRFKATMTLGKDGDIVREINGRVGGDRVSWDASDARVIGASPKAQAKAKAAAKAQGKAAVKAQAVGGSNEGVFRGDEIHFTFKGPGDRKGEFTLRKTR